jgi:hypothetical protein
MSGLLHAIADGVARLLALDGGSINRPGEPANPEPTARGESQVEDSRRDSDDRERELSILMGTWM